MANTIPTHALGDISARSNMNTKGWKTLILPFYDNIKFILLTLLIKWTKCNYKRLNNFRRLKQIISRMPLPIKIIIPTR